MKKAFALIAFLAVVSAAAGCSSAAGDGEPRTATAYAASHGGPLTVKVTVSGGRIDAIELLEFNDTAAVGGAAAEVIIGKVLESGAAKVDAVSGATVTSMALLQAIEQAAKAAGAAAEGDSLSAPPPEDAECDVLVIGGGGAGLYAALTAARMGAKVTLCERLSILGGSAALSGGSIAVESGGEGEPQLQTEATVKELRELGATLLLYPERAVYTAVDPATGLTGGGGVISPLVEAVRSAGVEIYTDTSAYSLTTDSAGAVTGALLRNGSGSFSVSASSVIICTGGNAAQQFAQEVGAVMVMTSAGNDGSGIDMAVSIGARASAPLPLISSVSCPDPAAGILVTPSGKRFCSEAAGEYEIAAALMAEGESECYFISDRPRSALAAQAQSAAELAEKIGAPELEGEIERYNSFCRFRFDEDFGKPSSCLEAVSGDRLYAEKRAIVVYGTVGGLLVDNSCAVLSERGTIPNLYAAGEAANAVFFEKGYAGDGWSLAQVFYSARVAGRAAAENAAAAEIRPAGDF